MRSVCELIMGRRPRRDEGEIDMAASTTFKLDEREWKRSSRGRSSSCWYGASIRLWDFGCHFRFLESGKEREGLLISMIDFQLDGFFYNKIHNCS